jgi:uncharacterized membrane protein YgcG
MVIMEMAMGRTIVDHHHGHLPQRLTVHPEGTTVLIPHQHVHLRERLTGHQGEPGPEAVAGVVLIPRPSAGTSRPSASTGSMGGGGGGGRSMGSGGGSRGGGGGGGRRR